MAKNKPKFKMSVEDRAKQFAPFSPLSGLEAALAEREKLREERRHPDGDAITAINTALTELKKGDAATVFFYNTEETRYEQTEGEISIIDDLHSRLFLCGKEIRFSDILEISIKNREN